MNNLGEALGQIRQALVEGEEPVRAVREAAMDFGLNPDLLLRKWGEQHGCTPEEWRERHTQNVLALNAGRAAAVRAASAKAREAAKKWLLPAPQTEMVGRLFRHGKQEYAFAVFAMDNPRWAIRAVRVQDGRLVNLPAEAWRAIEPQLRQTVRVRQRQPLPPQREAHHLGAD